MILQGTARGTREWHDWFLCSGSIRLKSTRLQCHPRQQFYWDLGLLPSSLLAHRIQFPCSCRTEFSCRLLLGSARDLTGQTQDVQSSPWAICNTVHFVAAGRVSALLSLTSLSPLKVLAWLGRTHPDNLSSDWLQVNWLGTLVTSQNPSTFARWCDYSQSDTSASSWVTHIQRAEIIQCGHTRGQESWGNLRILPTTPFNENSWARHFTYIINLISFTSDSIHMK